MGGSRLRQNRDPALTLASLHRSRPRMASVAITAILFVLLSSINIVYPSRKIGASGDACSGVLDDFVNKVVRIKIAAHLWLGNDNCPGKTAGGRRRRRCGLDVQVPVVGNFTKHGDSGSWQVVEAEGSNTVMLKSCRKGFFLHSPLGQKHGENLKMDDSTSVGSRWCMMKQGDKVYFKSARNGRFVWYNGEDANVVGSNNDLWQTQWEVSTRD